MDYSTYFLSKKEMMVCIGKGILAGMLAAWILYQSVYGMVTVFIFIPLCIQREKRKRQEQELDYISSGQTFFCSSAMQCRVLRQHFRRDIPWRMHGGRARRR